MVLNNRCATIAYIHLLILVGGTQGASTVYARLGETATLSWDLPTPGLKTFRVSVTEYHWYRFIFLVTNYNNVTVMNNEPISKMEFVGNISPSGTGVFSFMLHDVTFEDGGFYRCYNISPNSEEITEVPECGQTLVIFDFQQPYIAAPDTTHMDKNVTLSCFSVFKLHGPTDEVVSMQWWNTGLLVHDRIEFIITQESHAWHWGLKYHKSTLTLSSVRTTKADNVQCQAVLGQKVVSGWSEVYALVKQPGSSESYTLIREGLSAFIIWKISLGDEDVLVWGPGKRQIFQILFPGVYIFRTYTLRVNIRKVTTSADAVILQFWLHRVTSEDAGRYYCSTWRNDPIPNCSHILYVQGNPAHPQVKVIVNTKNIVLTCETNSSIDPEDHDLTRIYTWQRNGHEVERGERFHFSAQTLAVNDVKREDLGNYTCQSIEEGLASNWSDTVDLHILARPEVRELTVNGTAYTTVKENQVVVFRCMVEDYLSPTVSLIQENSLTAVNMSRKQHNVYEHVMVVRKCSQLGVYSCRATNVAGSSEDEHPTVVLRGIPRKQASRVYVTHGEASSMVINITLCSYPGPSKPTLRFTPSGNLRDFADLKKFHLATTTLKHNAFEYYHVLNNITEADFGVYIFSVEYNHSSTDFIIPAAASIIKDTSESNLAVVAGCSVAAVIATLIIIAGVILLRLNQLKDYWHLRFRSYVTPMQNMPGSIDDREYAEIDDADLPERDAGNPVQPVVNVPHVNSIPVCSSRHRRERQQLEGEDDEYEDVGPLGASSIEGHSTEQKVTAEIQASGVDEMTMTLPGSHSHSEPRIVVADWSAGEREFGNTAAGRMILLAETSFVTEEPDETSSDMLLTASGTYSGAGGMTAVKAEADKLLVDGREDFAESELLDLPCDRYESLMLHQPQDTYTVLANDDDITHG